MNSKLILAVAGALAAVGIGVAAIAQTAPEITVQASRIIAKDVGSTASGARILDVSLDYAVSYSGLDLASHAGAMQFEKRVTDAAKAACKQLGRQYPGSTPDDVDCAKAATDKAMVKVHELEAAAAKSPGR